MRTTRGLLIELAEVAALALILYFAITFALQTVHVIGSSMYPTVQDQDYLVALKLPYRFHAPERGDIIIMRSPYNPSQDFIKRVVGVPGDQVLIRNGHTYINGHELCEPYLRPGVDGVWTNDANWPASGQAVRLGSDQYFVMGDNRNGSSDSRVFGPVRQNQIEAEGWLRVLPLSHFGVIGAERPYVSNGAPAPSGSASAAAC